MHFLSPTTTLAVLIATSSAQQLFHIYPFSTTYGQYEAEQDPGFYQVSFNISRPGAVFEQGGDDSYSCYIHWYPQNGAARSCYIPCEGDGGNAQYWARINPESVKQDLGKELGISFAVDILEYYSYRNSVVQNATFTVAEGETPCYRCESSYYRGFTNDWCELKEDKGQVTAKVDLLGYGIYPIYDVAPICESWQGRSAPMGVQPPACWPHYCLGK